MIINPYKRGSRGAKALKEALRQQGEKSYIVTKTPQSTKAMIINWGNSEFDFNTSSYPFIVNTPGLVADMTNKRRFFHRVGHSELIPKWTLLRAEALGWNTKTMARTVLEGSGGKGIVVWNPDDQGPEELPEAPLYVKYENKTHEFRVHMARSFYGQKFEPILVQRKIFRKTEQKPQPSSWDVRNHASGFVYVRESGYPTPSKVLNVASDFMEQHFGNLHFVALDIIYHDRRDAAYVLEGNTAPGLEGNTIEVYAKYFSEIRKELT